MKTACRRGSLPLLAVTLLLVYAGAVRAQGPNLALNKPLIDESSEWLNGGANPNPMSQYNGSHVTDGIVCEMDQNEGGHGISSYWIAAEGMVNQTIIIDLGAPTMITEIHLRNTHNAQYNDRNTMDFQINADNATQSCSDLSGTRTITSLVNPVTILMGTVSDVDGITCPDEIPPDIFDSTSGLSTGGVAYRYLQFMAINSYHDPNLDGRTENVGLNELEVYGSQ
jgi:hypothetical protein